MPAYLCRAVALRLFLTFLVSVVPTTALAQENGPSAVVRGVTIAFQNASNTASSGRGVTIGFQNTVNTFALGRAVSIAFQNVSTTSSTGRGVSIAFQNAPPTVQNTLQRGLSIGFQNAGAFSLGRGVGIGFTSSTNLLFDISTGGTTFPQGATVPFSAVVSDASAPSVPLTSSSVGVQLTVVGPTSASVFGPTALSFNPVTGHFTGSLGTSGLAVGTYRATFTFATPAGITLGVRSTSFDLVGGASLTLSSNKPAYGRGESVALGGRVRDSSGNPLAGVAVTLRISTHAASREFSVFSNAQGNYEFVFTPPLSEAGTYVAAARASDGGAAEVTATFIVHGLMLDPASTTASMTMNSTLAVPLRIRNIGETKLTALTVIVESVNAGLGFTIALNPTTIAALEPGGVEDLTALITAPAGSAPSFPVSFRVVTVAAEDVSDTASIAVNARNAAGIPVVDPASATIGLSPGSSRLVSLTLRNESASPILSAQARLQDPATFNWVVIQDGALGSLASGESKAFGVALFPPANLASGSYVINIEVATGLSTIVVPLTVDITSSGMRAVSLQVSDDAARDVADASVQLVSERLLANSTASGTASNQIYQGTTDASGRLTFPAIAAGTYTLRVLAAQHADYETAVIIEAGISPQEIEVLLSTTVASFNFKVTPTAIADQYDVALVVTYSTDLVKPALVVSPARCDLSFFRDGQGQRICTVTVTNSHTQAAVRNVIVDASGLDLTSKQITLADESGASSLVIASLGPRQSVTRMFTATMHSAEEPPSHPLGSIVVTADYDYSLHGAAKLGTTTSQVFVTYTKPDSLRLFPALEFLNDETGPIPVFTYRGNTTRFTLENERTASITFKDFNGQPVDGPTPTPTPTVKAVQMALAASVVPLEFLNDPASRVLWTGDLASGRLDGLHSQTTFDIGQIDSAGKDLLAALRGKRRDVASNPPFLAVVGRWNDGGRAEGFVFPISIMTIRPSEVQVIQSGWNACLCGPGGVGGGTAPPQPFNNHGVVKVQIDQKVSVEREAFTASLDIIPAVASLDNFSAVLSIRNADGSDASDKFVVIPTLPPSPIVGSAHASWLIIPLLSAGGTTADGLGYTATAHIVYSVRGVPATFDTALESLTVLPLPKLTLTYTLPYVVMGHIPFELTLDVANAIDGGTANNVKIESAQPRIIENINRIDVDFKINSNPMVDLGTIPPGQMRSGFWVVESTRRGFIIDFAAGRPAQRTPNGKLVDPVIEKVNLYFQPAVGGSVTLSGCGLDLGPISLALSRNGGSLQPALGSDGSYYFREVGSRFLSGSLLVPPPVRYVLTASHRGVPVRIPDVDGQLVDARNIDVHADQPTDFADISADILDSDHDDIPDCWERENPPFDPNDPSDADVTPSIASVDPVFGAQDSTMPRFTVAGAYFQPGSRITFSDAGISVTEYLSRTSTRIVANVRIAPSTSLGPQEVIITNPHSQEDRFTFEVVPRPRLLGIEVTPPTLQEEKQTYKVSFLIADAFGITCKMLHNAGIETAHSYGSVTGTEILGALYEKVSSSDKADFKCTRTPDSGAPAVTRFDFEVTHDWAWIKPLSLEEFAFDILTAGLDFLDPAKLQKLIQWLLSGLGVIETYTDVWDALKESYDAAPKAVYKYSLQNFPDIDSTGASPSIATVTVVVKKEKIESFKNYLVDNIGCFVPLAASIAELDPAAALSLLCTALSDRMYQAAVDPQPTFTTIARPSIRAEIDILPPGTPREAAALYLNALNAATGFADSYARYHGALDAGDSNWAYAQLKASEKYLTDLIAIRLLVVPLELDVIRPSLPLSANDVAGAQASLAGSGFPASVGSFAASLGLGADDLEHLKLTFVGIRPSLLALNEAEVSSLRMSVVDSLGEILTALHADIQSRPLLDEDNDGIPDAVDDCPTTPNFLQIDADLDGFGDACQAEHVPIADSGADQVVEATSPGGATVVLDGSGSSDPDGDPLRFTWAGPFGQLIGSLVTPTLPVGVYSITLTVDDGKEGIGTDMLAVTVRDTQSPVISISAPVAATYTFGQLVAANYACTDEGSGIATCTGPVPSGTNIDTGSLGAKIFTINAQDNVGNQSSRSVDYTVVPAPTVVTVKLTSSVQQYSDAVTVTATLDPAALAGQAPARSVTFLVGSQVLGTAPLTAAAGSLQASLSNIRLREPVPFGTSPTDQMSPGTHTVTAIFEGVNSSFIVTNPTTMLTITKEDARATYTGALFASAACVSCSTATVTLSATVQDISAIPADPVTDPTEGDIRNATVTFQIVETGQTITGVPVGLVNTADTKTGTAARNVTVNLGNAPAMRLTVRAMADGYYTSPVEEAVISVAKPLSETRVKGSGSLLLSDSAGLYPGQPGTTNDFDLDVKNSEGRTRPEGSLSILIRSNGRLYQIRSVTVNSLATNRAIGTATVTANASVRDVTDPLNQVLIDRDATLQVTVTDVEDREDDEHDSDARRNGGEDRNAEEPSRRDSIGITVWKKAGGLWFSSNWSGTQTKEQALTQGNLVVR